MRDKKKRNIRQGTLPYLLPPCLSPVSFSRHTDLRANGYTRHSAPGAGRPRGSEKKERAILSWVPGRGAENNYLTSHPPFSRPHKHAPA